MPDTTDEETAPVTDPKLKTVKGKAVTTDGEKEAPPVVGHDIEYNPWELVDYQGPDVWDEQGRLVSHRAFTDVR